MLKELNLWLYRWKSWTVAVAGDAGILDGQQQQEQCFDESSERALVDALRRTTIHIELLDVSGCYSPTKTTVNSTTLVHSLIEVAIQSCAFLKILRLDSNDLEASHADTISRALTNSCTGLEELYLTNNNSGDDGASYIAQALMTYKLYNQGNARNSQELDVFGHNIGSSYNYCCCCSLRVCDLGKNRISDSGCMAFAVALQHNNKLVQLNLGGNRITELGAKKLVISLQIFNTTVEEVWCWGNEDISDEIQNALHRERRKNVHSKVLVNQILKPKNEADSSKDIATRVTQELRLNNGSDNALLQEEDACGIERKLWPVILNRITEKSDLLFLVLRTILVNELL